MTSLAAIRNADKDLAAIRIALRRLGLEASTDIAVTADHGFATVYGDVAGALGRAVGQTP